MFGYQTLNVAVKITNIPVLLFMIGSRSFLQEQIGEFENVGIIGCLIV
jgi:hypothetical protein